MTQELGGADGTGVLLPVALSHTAQDLDPLLERHGPAREYREQLGVIQPCVGAERRKSARVGTGRNGETPAGGLAELTASGAPALGPTDRFDEPAVGEAAQNVVDGRGRQGGPLPVSALLDDPVEVLAVARLLGQQGEEDDVGVGGHAHYSSARTTNTPALE